MTYLPLFYLLGSPILMRALSRIIGKKCTDRGLLHDGKYETWWMLMWRMAEALIAGFLLSMLWKLIWWTAHSYGQVNPDPVAVLIAAAVYTWVLGIAYGIVPLIFIVMIPLTASSVFSKRLKP